MTMSKRWLKVWSKFLLINGGYWLAFQRWPNAGWTLIHWGHFTDKCWLYIFGYSALGQYWLNIGPSSQFLLINDGFWFAIRRWANVGWAFPLVHRFKFYLEMVDILAIRRWGQPWQNVDPSSPSLLINSAWTSVWYMTFGQRNKYVLVVVPSSE